MLCYRGSFKLRERSNNKRWSKEQRPTRSPYSLGMGERRKSPALLLAQALAFHCLLKAPSGAGLVVGKLSASPSARLDFWARRLDPRNRLGSSAALRVFCLSTRGEQKGDTKDADDNSHYHSDSDS